MPTWAPGSRRTGAGRARAGAFGFARGFTLIELVIVLAIVAVSSALVMLALRDGYEAKLEEEGERLAALLEMARAEARVQGTAVIWLPRRGDGNEVDPNVQFRFVGLSDRQPMPTRWLDGDTQAQVVGANSVVLGPEAILPPQRIVLLLADKRLELASDGLAPFAVARP
jgi:general secretion pathway protein H